MLNTRTLLVLGAGASFDFGMPLGAGLSALIAKKVDIKFDFPRQISGDADLMEVLRLIAQRERRDVNLYRAAGCSIAEGIGYSRSIDSYFSAHEDNEYVKTCGKLAIVQSILESERGCALWVDQTQRNTQFQHADKVMASWLNDLMFLLSTGIVRSKTLEQVFDNLVVVNFNYDRCIEQFFFHSLRQMFQISESEAAHLVRKKLRMLRPYGQVGELPMDGRGVPFGAKLHASQYEGIANGIRTFNEQIEENELLAQVHEEVEKCERVIFLGFHFHKQNVDFLTPKTLAPIDGSRPMRVCYGTATGRSGPDVSVIQSRIRQMFHNQITGDRMELGIWDCKEIFRMYATTWGA